MDIGKIGEELFGDISEKFDSFCSEVDEAINCKLKYVENQLSAVGARIEEFWSEIVQDIVDQSPEESVDVEEVEVTKISDSQMPTAIVDKEKNNSDTCSIPKVNTMVPDDRLQRELSLEENAATGMYYNSFASYKENCIDEAKITSLGSCESISRSFIEWERSWYVDTYTDVASDQQADDPVAFSKLSEAKLSDQGVESDDLPSILSSGSCESISRSFIEWERSWYVDTNTDVASDQQADDPVAFTKLSEAKLSDQGVESDDLRSLLSSGRSDVSGTEDVLDLEDYEKVDDINHREENNGRSNLKSAEIEKNKPLEDEERVKSCVLTSPGANSVGRDEDVSEDDWVVI